MSQENKDETIAKLMALVDSLQQNNHLLETKQQETDKVVQLLKEELVEMRHQLAGHDERHASLLSELNTMKEHNETLNNNNTTISALSTLPAVSTVVTTGNMQEQEEQVTVKRSIPAPSKFLVEEQKKKDNRLLELRRITKEYKNVDDEEAGLRLYKLQKTMVHVVSDLKKYMKSKDEDITKSWKSIDLNTQRVAFEMVEKEAISLGVPLNMCIGYWGARRLISKSWANALRTSKKNTTTTTTTKPEASTTPTPTPTPCTPTVKTDDDADADETRQIGRAHV